MKKIHTLRIPNTQTIFITSILLSIGILLNVGNMLDSGMHSFNHHIAFGALVVKVSIISGSSTLGDKAFSPNPVTIKEGNTVMWINNDNQFHTVTSGDPGSSGGAAIGKVFDSGLSGPNALTAKGKTFSHTFNEKGEFSYFCQLHPTMIGKVIVT
jgi:plastocyanin